jgi:hypothetical protein
MRQVGSSERSNLERMGCSNEDLTADHIKRKKTALVN